MQPACCLIPIHTWHQLISFLTLPPPGKIQPILKNESIALSQYTIIIDGHNLAFYLYNLQHGQHLSQKDALTLVNQLSDYLKSFRSANPEIELCFDGGVRPPTADPARVRILAAGAHNTADNLILDRFRYHAFSNHPCLVITNDAEIQEILDQEDGHYLKCIRFCTAAASCPSCFSAPRGSPLRFSRIDRAIKQGFTSKRQRDPFKRFHPPNWQVETGPGETINQ